MIVGVVVELGEGGCMIGGSEVKEGRLYIFVWVEDIREGYF